MRVLIGGEFKGKIRDAFIARGHYAMSCDIDKPSPGPHYLGDWWDVMFDGWDLAIFHPTCTFMANSSAKHLFRGMKKENGLNEDRCLEMFRAAWDIYDLIERCPVPFVAIENPVMLRYAQIMSELEKLPKQVVQPWWFGDDPDGPDNVTKATCWWLKGGLPKLKPTGILNGSTARDECFKATPTEDPEDRRMSRSEFTPGHALAIAKQWGDYVSNAARERAA